MNIGKLLAGTSAFHHKERLDQTAAEKAAAGFTTERAEKSLKPREDRNSDHIAVAGIWREVARNIDVREANPREIISLSSQLFEAGVISYDDHMDLSFQPEVNPDSNEASSVPFNHDKKDYIDLWQRKEQNVIRSGGDRNQIEDTHRIQAILAYVDSLK